MGPGDMVLIFDGHGEGNSAWLTKQLEAAKKNKKFHEKHFMLMFAEGGINKAKNRGLGSAGNFETMRLVSVDDPYLLKKRTRSEQFGGGSTANCCYTNLTMPALWSMPQVKYEDLAKLFPDVKYAFSQVPWQDGTRDHQRLPARFRMHMAMSVLARQSEFLVAVGKDMQVGEWVDLTPVWGPLAFASIEGDDIVAYVAVTNNSFHTQHLLDAVDDHYAKSSAKAGHPRCSQVLKDDLIEIFPNLFKAAEDDPADEGDLSGDEGTAEAGGA